MCIRDRYVHLAVYQRIAGLPKADAQRRGALHLAYQFVVLATIYALAQQPVSYTHLDVYKRQAHASEICAFILEPLVQCAGGMRMHHPHYLRRVRALCDAHGIFLIADEIAVGFGRTGTPVSYTHLDVYKRQELARLRVFRRL